MERPSRRGASKQDLAKQNLEKLKQLKATKGKRIDELVGDEGIDNVYDEVSTRARCWFCFFCIISLIGLNPFNGSSESVEKCFFYSFVVYTSSDLNKRARERERARACVGVEEFIV